MMTRDFHHSELGPLAPLVEELHSSQADVETIDEAQQALLARLEKRAGKRSPAGQRSGSGRWVLVPVLALLISSLIGLSGLLPLTSSVAFADVQRYFHDFQTLYADMNINLDGESMMGMQVFVDDDDRARIDMDEVSYVVDGRKGSMMILMHSSRAAQWVEFPPGSATERQELGWLQRIRDFQGSAVHLSEQRTIAGRLADGYELHQNGHVLTLWAASDDGRPLHMEGQFGVTGVMAESMTMSLDFDFDRPLDESLFAQTLPEGYRWVDGDE